MDLIYLDMGIISMKHEKGYLIEGLKKDIIYVASHRGFEAGYRQENEISSHAGQSLGNSTK